MHGWADVRRTRGWRRGWTCPASPARPAARPISRRATCTKTSAPWPCRSGLPITTDERGRGGLLTADPPLYAASPAHPADDRPPAPVRHRLYGFLVETDR